MLEVVIDYVNHKGQRARRCIRPIRLYFGSTEYHPDKQWLLQAEDLDKAAERTFAMKDVTSWVNLPR